MAASGPIPPGESAVAAIPSPAGPDAERRRRKFRQAAFVYLHVALLYEFVVFVLWREQLLPETRGSGPVWLLLGAAITAFVFWGLWRWQHPRFAQAIWVLHALRLPAIIRGAFFATEAALLPPGLYILAIPIVLVNLWMLARAGFDL
jgi:hypothetical protein